MIQIYKVCSLYEVLSRSSQNVSEKKQTRSRNHHCPLHSSPFDRVCNNPDVPATIRSCVGSPVSASSAYFAIQPDLYNVKSLPLQADFQLGEAEEVTRSQLRKVRGYGTTVTFWRPKTAAQQSGMCRRIVVMRHPVVCVPSVYQLQPHILPKQPQDVTVQLRIDNLTWRDKFLLENPNNVKKVDQYWLQVAFTCRTFFG